MKKKINWIPEDKAAQALGRSVAAVRSEAQAGTLPGKVVRGRWKIARLSIIDRLAQQLAAAAECGCEIK